MYSYIMLSIRQPLAAEGHVPFHVLENSAMLDGLHHVALEVVEHHFA